MDNELEDRKFMEGFGKLCAIVSLMIGIVVLVFFVIKVSQSHSIPSKGEVLNLTSFGAFGDFIGGTVGTLLSLSGFFVIYLTFKDQRESFYKERLESNFFEMVKFNRENVNEMMYTYYEDKKSKVTAEKRKVFKIAFGQFKEAWSELDHIFQGETVMQIYEKQYYKDLKRNAQIIKRKIDLKEIAQVDLIYQIVFFGLSKEDKQTILNMSHNKYKKEFVSYLLEYASLKPKRESCHWSKWELINNNHDTKNSTFKILALRKDDLSKTKGNCHLTEINSKDIMFSYPNKNQYDKYYGGHQFRFGHYFRHLFQTVKFIDNDKYLTDDEKYYYIKILRGQLSNYEQLMLFINSLSQLGRTWEISKKEKSRKENSKREDLITYYNLIKNIPIQYVVGTIDLLVYYPEVDYECIPKKIKIAKML